MVADDVSIVANDDSCVPKYVRMTCIAFEDGTNDHHIELFRFRSTETDRRSGNDILSEFTPMLFSSAECKRHRPCFLETKHLDFCFSCHFYHRLHMINDRLRLSEAENIKESYLALRFKGFRCWNLNGILDQSNPSHSWSGRFSIWIQIGEETSIDKIKISIYRHRFQRVYKLWILFIRSSILAKQQIQSRFLFFIWYIFLNRP